MAPRLARRGTVAAPALLVLGLLFVRHLAPVVARAVESVVNPPAQALGVPTPAASSRSREAPQNLDQRRHVEPLDAQAARRVDHDALRARVRDDAHRHEPGPGVCHWLRRPREQRLPPNAECAIATTNRPSARRSRKCWAPRRRSAGGYRRPAPRGPARRAAVLNSAATFSRSIARLLCKRANIRRAGRLHHDRVGRGLTRRARPSAANRTTCSKSYRTHLRFLVSANDIVRGTRVAPLPLEDASCPEP